VKTSTYFALIVRYNYVCTSTYEYILPYTHTYFDIQVHPSMYEYIRVRTSTYKYILCYTEPHYCQVRRARAYLDSLSMDGAEVAINCLCSARSCATCWCPDSELADAHRGVESAHTPEWQRRWRNWMQRGTSSWTMTTGLLGLSRM
jgi:hypothetical protein